MRLSPLRLSPAGRSLGFTAAAVFVLATAPAAAEPITAPPVDPWSLCLPAIAKAETDARLPRHLLRAIALAESGRRHPESGRWTPWPWAINNAGDSYYLDAKDEAVAAVKGLRGEGETNIDVGCMQVNLSYHPEAFDSLATAFDPVTNADYAARLLRTLFRQTGSWPFAVQKYHSGKFRNNYGYRLRVMRLWSQLRGR